MPLNFYAHRIALRMEIPLTAGIDRRMRGLE